MSGLFALTCFALRKDLAAAEGWVEHEIGEETRCLDKPGLTRVSVVLTCLAETQSLTVPGLIWVSVAYVCALATVRTEKNRAAALLFVPVFAWGFSRDSLWVPEQAPRDPQEFTSGKLMFGKYCLRSASLRE